MAVKIIGTTSGQEQEVDTTSKAARVIIYDSSGALLGTTGNPIKTSEVSGRIIVNEFSLSTFRTLGTAVTPQNIATIENPSGSTVKLAIKRMTLQWDNTALLATVSPSIKTSRLSSLPTGGTVISAVKFDTSKTGSQAVIRGGTASDGGAATAITASAGVTIWAQFVDRMQTAAGFVWHDDYSLLPAYIATSPFILLAGESLLIQGVLANAATTHFVVNIAWEEYT